MFSKYIAYLKDNPERYWFKRKLFGWGWTPVTWQGWLVTIAYIVIIIALLLSVDVDAPLREVVFIFWLPFVLLTGAFIRVCYRTGEKPRWQWGLPKNEE